MRNMDVRERVSDEFYIEMKYIDILFNMYL